MNEGIGTYVYWSQRTIQATAECNGIQLTDRRKGSIGFKLGPLQSTLKTRERVTRDRLREAQRLAAGLGDAVTRNLDDPEPVMFVAGAGGFEFARFDDRRPDGMRSAVVVEPAAPGHLLRGELQHRAGDDGGRGRSVSASRPRSLRRS
ncbi:hypothetical protein BTM25_52420 [Actinomadura rubteroloni]|uniref:Uncharacterized protein n=1 Tax=Actinomadura rubteroloni TaxID=1926885 RepID=A0A2P4UDD3_9ACTN|nr:hypothetical protein [Actinomadura rubteroloni]POM23036.1 hypothetical protein BTM25_52420 [Actinomadura rubteroloni]